MSRTQPTGKFVLWFNVKIGTLSKLGCTDRRVDERSTVFTTLMTKGRASTAGKRK